MTRVYYKEAAGAVVVFDVARGATFDGALKWKADLDQKLSLLDGRPIPAVLVANKVWDETGKRYLQCDIDDSLSPTDAELEAACRQHGFLKYFRTSAKENINVEQAMTFLASNVSGIFSHFLLPTQILYVKQAEQYEVSPYISDEDARKLTGADQPRRRNNLAGVLDKPAKKACC